MSEIKIEAFREFREYADRQNPEYIFEIYENVSRSHARNLKRYRQKSKNPVNCRTGKLLHKDTLKKYQADIESTTKHLLSMELAIEMLNKFGLVGNEKRSINDIQEYYRNKEVPYDDQVCLAILEDIKKEKDAAIAKRERMIHQIKTCPRDCPLKDIFGVFFLKETPEATPSSITPGA